jgi:hypothetical protein
MVGSAHSRGWKIAFFCWLHWAFQLANMPAMSRKHVVGNVVALAGTAKIFSAPTVLTTVLEERGHHKAVAAPA